MKLADVLPGIAVSAWPSFLEPCRRRFSISIPVELPPVALFAAVLILAALPLLAGRWVLTLGIFLVWLVVEELVRKLAGNNLAVYFVKDLIYLVLLSAVHYCLATAGEATGNGPAVLTTAHVLGDHHGCASDCR